MNKEQWGSFGLGILAGAFLGAVAAALYTPKSGREMRAQIKEKAGSLYEAGRGKVSDIRHTIGDKLTGEEHISSSVGGDGEVE